MKHTSGDVWPLEVLKVEDFPVAGHMTSRQVLVQFHEGLRLSKELVFKVSMGNQEDPLFDDLIESYEEVSQSICRMLDLDPKFEYSLYRGGNVQVIFHKAIKSQSLKRKLWLACPDLTDRIRDPEIQQYIAWCRAQKPVFAA